MPPGSFQVHVEAGERLDRALAAVLSELSRASVQRMIEERLVLVRGRPARAGYRLRAGDLVEWQAAPASPSPSSIEPEAIPLQVVFEDEHLLVIDKPKGMVVHPAPGHRSGTLVHAVLAHTGERPPASAEAERPGIVHRLDRDTSGLLVVAKTDLALRSLQRQIQARTVERRYLALVRGSPRFERATVEAPIGRHPTDRKRMAVIPPGSERRHRDALTELEVLERFAGFALLEARLRTGRTHQIRVHCAYIHLPVVGDAVYGPRRLDRDGSLEPGVREAISALEGQALHAYRLEFDHPATGERLQFLSRPGPDIRRLLTALGSDWEAGEDPRPDLPS